MPIDLMKPVLDAIGRGTASGESHKSEPPPSLSAAGGVGALGAGEQAPAATGDDRLAKGAEQGAEHGVEPGDEPAD
jgi:hypothetical protein